jgi:hypothetical protein
VYKLIKTTNMKKILGVLFGLFLTTTIYANGVVVYSDVNNAEKAKTEGVFNFKFDTSFKLEDINKTAKYYTSYFTVKPVKVDDGFNVKISLVDDNEMARRVVTRFFVSLNVKEIMVNEKPIPIDDFVAKFVMK